MRICGQGIIALAAGFVLQTEGEIVVVAMLIIAFAIVVVLFGGGDPDASQLYYDADFVELYDTEDNAEGKPIKQVKEEVVNESPAVNDVEEIPTTLDGDGDVDPRLLTREIYEDIVL